ncbi:MAG: crossover junction endodeoxyribonuclease RuvC [Saccharofermentanales bacterium]
MIIIGIDPGYAITGYGIVKYENHKLSVIDYGVISTKSSMPFEKRLLAISEKLEALCSTYKPDSMAVEELFFSRNTTTAMGTAHARGVAILTGARSGISIYEYTPLQVKMAVTGYGRADKKQIDYMVKLLLKIKEDIRPDDAADALAVAICHAHTGSLKSYEAIGGYQ